MNEIERLLVEDIKAKRMAIYKPTIYKYKKQEKHKEGEIFMYNINNEKYDNLNWEQFKELKGEERLTAFKYLYFEVFKSNVAEMAKYMGCRNNNIHDMKYRLGLTEKKEYKIKAKAKDKIVEEVENKMEQKFDLDALEKKMEKIVNIVSSFTLNCENIKGIDLRDRLEGLVRMINDANDYQIKVEFKEYEE